MDGLDKPVANGLPASERRISSLELSQWLGVSTDALRRAVRGERWDACPPPAGMAGRTYFWTPSCVSKWIADNGLSNDATYHESVTDFVSRRLRVKRQPAGL